MEKNTYLPNSITKPQCKQCLYLEIIGKGSRKVMKDIKSNS